MAEHVTDEHGGSSIAKLTTTSAFRNKLNIIWQHIKSKSHDLAYRYKVRFMPTEAMLFLSMCSIFPNGLRIPIEELVIYGMGLDLFDDVHDMTAARFRVHDIISIINDKKYSRKEIGANIELALEKDGPRNQYIKILDGARILAESIASSCPIVFHRETVIEKWPKSNSYRDCFALSLVLKKVNEHVVNLECPRLSLLLLQYTEDSQSIPDDFFKGMKKLSVLSLDLPLLPRSLSLLRNLRTLRLKVPKCEDMSLIGGLVKLEFLSINIPGLTEIPREMGQLEKLRLLDLRKMNIAYIPPGVFSRLLQLEELYLPLSFRRWICKAKNKNDDDYDEWEIGEQDDYDVEGRINADISEIDDGKRLNPSIIEIVSLSLNALEICVPEASFFGKKSPIFKNIQEYKILMPNNELYQPFGDHSTNVLQLTGEACDIKDSGICDLFSRAEELCLKKVRNLKNGIDQLGGYDFPQLKKMIISECDELLYMSDKTKNLIRFGSDYLFRQLECLHLSMLSNLTEICHERWTNFGWFPNLSQISIRFCPKLKYVFPLSIFRGLKLKGMEILDCFAMEGILYEDENDNMPLTFGSIEKLDLHLLPRLICLLVRKDNTIDGVHNDINESLTINKVSCMKNNVISHTKMYSLFPSSLAKWFPNLKSLKIAFCYLLEVVFLFEENHATSEAFNSLEVLELHGLRNLVHIWFRISPKINAFKNLQLLVLFDCCNLYLFSYAVATLLVQLKKIYISRCEMMGEIIVEDGKHERKSKIVLPRLKLLELRHMPNLRILFSGDYEIELPSLESLKLEQCNGMKALSYGMLKIPMLMGVEVNGSFHLLTKDHNAIFSGVTTLHNFTFADLKIATENFSSDNLLLKGAVIRVYKGWIDRMTFLPSKTGIGMPVAIKRVNRLLSENLKLEMNILKNILHPNIVKLLGHCSEGAEYLLVYEFIPRGALSDLLFKGDIGVKPLSWNTRIKIAIGIARGLNYLHTFEPKVVHRDIRSANILLDSNYNAKISGFDVSIIVSTNGIDSPVHVADDVCCFGEVLLELITGLKAYDYQRPQEQIDLVRWLQQIPSQELRDMMNSTVEGQYSSAAILLTAELVLKCTDDCLDSRPTMGEVLEELQQIDRISNKQKW